MKKTLSTMVVLGAVALGFSLLAGQAQEARAGDVQAIEAKAVPNFNAVAYIAGHGGHLAIIDLRTMVPPVDADEDRIVLTEAGSEMEGVIAGMSFEQVKKSGGSHGQAMVEEGGQKVLVAGTLAR